MNALEALTNALIGLCVSWAATYWLLPIWGFAPSPMASLGITGTFFVLSFIRAYVLRLIFARFT